MAEEGTNQPDIIAVNAPKLIKGRVFTINNKGLNQNNPNLETGFADPNAWVEVKVTPEGTKIRGGREARYLDSADPNNPKWKVFPQTNDKLVHPFIEFTTKVAGIWLRNANRPEGQLVNITPRYVKSRVPFGSLQHLDTEVSTIAQTLSIKDM